MTRTAGALIGRRRSSAFWGLGCPKTHHEIKDSLVVYLAPESVFAVDDAELVAQLRSGGYTLYFRHVATDWSKHDQVNKVGDWLSCSVRQMRQLSDSGRAEARRIGQAIRDLGIPVGQVLASPYCRTMETAKLFDIGPVIPSTVVINLRTAGYFGGRDKIIASAQRLLSTLPAAGANRVVVAHGNVAREATPVYPGEGEGVVFRADGKSGFDVIARIPPDRWRRMLELDTRNQGDSVNR
ncbi:MAG: histidine phosphatase family protein [Candidatus Thiodiazotropha sp. L084R]